MGIEYEWNYKHTVVLCGDGLNYAAKLLKAQIMLEEGNVEDVTGNRSNSNLWKLKVAEWRMESVGLRVKNEGKCFSS